MAGLGVLGGYSWRSWAGPLCTRPMFRTDKGNPDTPHPQKWKMHYVLAGVLLKQNMHKHFLPRLSLPLQFGKKLCIREYLHLCIIQVMATGTTSFQILSYWKMYYFITQSGTFTEMHASISFWVFEKGFYIVCKPGRKQTACYQNKSHSAEKGQREVNAIT